MTRKNVEVLEQWFKYLQKRDEALNERLVALEKKVAELEGAKATPEETSLPSPPESGEFDLEI